MNHPAEPSQELLLCFDNGGNSIKPHTREEVHTLPLRYWHGTTGIWVVNRQGQLLCSKRSELLNQKPGKWQARFGGHVQSHQSFLENAVGELEEEVGLQVDAHDLYQIGEMRKSEEWKHVGLCYTYLYTGDGSDLKFNDGEITEVKWMSMEEFWKEYSNHPEAWASGCGLDDQAKIRDWLLSIKSE